VWSASAEQRPASGLVVVGAIVRRSLVEAQVFRAGRSACASGAGGICGGRAGPPSALAPPSCGPPPRRAPECLAEVQARRDGPVERRLAGGGVVLCRGCRSWAA